MLNSKNIFFLVLIFSILSISFAFFLQFILGHMPCKLCTYQRIPYYLIILIGLINFFNKKYFSYLYFFLFLLVIFEILVSGYHTLVTFEIIIYSGCDSANLPSDLTQLKKSLLNNDLIIDCSNANLRYFGIPLSLYNLLFSTFFLILIIYNAYKKKD